MKIPDSSWPLWGVCLLLCGCGAHEEEAVVMPGASSRDQQEIVREGDGVAPSSVVEAQAGKQEMSENDTHAGHEHRGEPNRLAEETSPYLLQHAYNPVDWYPWGEEAFAAARERNVPIFLSIGYSTCYWCHVMERESFESPQVAEIMNRDFVCIKVDREHWLIAATGLFPTHLVLQRRQILIRGKQGIGRKCERQDEENEYDQHAVDCVDIPCSGILRLVLLILLVVQGDEERGEWSSHKHTATHPHYTTPNSPIRCQ